MLTNCNEKSDSALNNNECVDIVCDQNLNEFCNSYSPYNPKYIFLKKTPPMRMQYSPKVFH